MSQEQPRREQEEEQQEPIKYGDVFQVSGDLASKPIAPQDAVMMQAAETSVFGQTVMAARPLSCKLPLRRMRGLASWAPAKSLMLLDSKVLGQYVQPTPVAAGAVPQGAITIGEALEVSGRAAGDKPVEFSDVAAIQAAECRATGSDMITPGGLTAMAQSAAAYNQAVAEDEGKVRLADVLTGATAKLPADKAATREDAEGIINAEVRNDPDLKTHPGGVAETVAAAARLNVRDT
ncbi:UNVERIFIED_CONTAM: Late embryogenesis abundant protein D-34 [Sesamum radiatum]|uniref:Late embryogenesis abundant protein D-34 n=1 Tax=Sesamum radiatum TaxID=300843 RepID=A0AAW2UBK3_SESRA